VLIRIVKIIHNNNKAAASLHRWHRFEVSSNILIDMVYTGNDFKKVKKVETLRTPGKQKEQIYY
jgi:hypothetical protein